MYISQQAVNHHYGVLQGAGPALLLCSFLLVQSWPHNAAIMKFSSVSGWGFNYQRIEPMCWDC